MKRYYIMKTVGEAVFYWTKIGMWLEAEFQADTFGEEEAAFIAAAKPGARLVRAPSDTRSMAMTKSYDVSVGLGCAEWHMQIDAPNGYAAGELALDAADVSLEEDVEITGLSGEADDGTRYAVCWRAA